MTKPSLKLFREAQLVFWDFDGVIKETVSIKGDVFEGLFRRYGKLLAARIRKHHKANGGVSRFEKIPLYLSWAGLPVSKKQSADYCRRFSQNVFRRVLKAPWVKGVEKVLRENPFRQEFILITATPQREIQKILKSLRLERCFTKAIGAPTPKIKAVESILCSRKLDPRRCLFIGDSSSDQKAASKNGVPFLFRWSSWTKRTSKNRNIITDFNFNFKDSPPKTKSSDFIIPFV